MLEVTDMLIMSKQSHSIVINIQVSTDGQIGQITINSSAEKLVLQEEKNKIKIRR